MIKKNPAVFFKKKKFLALTDPSLYLKLFKIPLLFKAFKLGILTLHYNSV